jgi:hypothetical protein
VICPSAVCSQEARAHADHHISQRLCGARHANLMFVLLQLLKQQNAAGVLA